MLKKRHEYSETVFYMIIYKYYTILNTEKRNESAS